MRSSCAARRDELIRAAIDGAYARRRELTTADRIQLARQAAGSWTEFPETGAEYVDRIRGSRRLSQTMGQS